MSNIDNKKFTGLGHWYWSMTVKQRKLCWIVSILSIVLWGIGLIGIVILLYCQFGKERYN